MKRFVIAALLLVGCGEELDPPSLLEKTRVVGARVEVEGAPERATPRPGETAKVTWLVTGPADTAPLSWAFVVCPGAGGSEPRCAGEPVALLSGHETAPVLSLPVPAAEHLGGVKQFVLMGRICVGSDPVIDATMSIPRCAGDAEGTTAAVSIALESAEVSNHNPNLSLATLEFAGAPWIAGLDTSCAALPQVRAGTKDHVIKLETAGEDREPYMAMMGDPPRPTPQREWLQISQFTTQGKLDRSFSSIEADDVRARPSVDMKWQAPAADKVPAEGLVVRFVFVARDLRGGIDWTSRAVCVTK